VCIFVCIFVIVTLSFDKTSHLKYCIESGIVFSTSLPRDNLQLCRDKEKKRKKRQITLRYSLLITGSKRQNTLRCSPLFDGSKQQITLRYSLLIGGSKLQITLRYSPLNDIIVNCLWEEMWKKQFRIL
jgi:hypothetical protein